MDAGLRLRRDLAWTVALRRRKADEREAEGNAQVRDAAVVVVIMARVVDVRGLDPAVGPVGIGVEAIVAVAVAEATEGEVARGVQAVAPEPLGLAVLPRLVLARVHDLGHLIVGNDFVHVLGVKDDLVVRVELPLADVVAFGHEVDQELVEPLGRFTLVRHEVGVGLLLRLALALALLIVLVMLGVEDHGVPVVAVLARGERALQVEGDGARAGRAMGLSRLLVGVGAEGVVVEHRQALLDLRQDLRRVGGLGQRADVVGRQVGAHVHPDGHLADVHVADASSGARAASDVAE